jgi:hypothetical protein
VLALRVLMQQTEPTQPAKTCGIYDIALLEIHDFNDSSSTLGKREVLGQSRSFPWRGNDGG